MKTTTFLVDGMTCQHCVNAVTAEVSSVPLVTGVRVDLENGTVTVFSDGDLDSTATVEAITTAGYSGRLA